MTTHRAAAPALGLLALGLALAASPLAPALGAPAPLADAHVHTQDFAYAPQSMTILLGETIAWDNHDLAPHTVTADDGSFDSGNMGNGAVYERAFTTIGTIAYHCDIHPSMTGTVVVADPNALPDLAVTGLSFADNLPGIEKRIGATVRNLGDNLAAASVLRVAYRYQGADVAIGDLDVPGLGPQANFTGNIAWRTLGKVGDFEVRATADADGEVVESNEANNQGSATTAVLLTGVPGIDLLDPVAG